jgi:hypothetical protein
MKGIAVILLLASIDASGQALLNGSASTNTVGYHWRQIGGAKSILQTPDSAFCKVDSLKAGTLIFELTCTNQFGMDKDSVMITVLPSPYSVQITSAVQKATSLVWTVEGERGVLYYWLTKSKDGWKTFTKVTNYYARGGIKYTYYLSKTIYKYLYRVTPVFWNFKKGEPVDFK